MRKNAIFYEFIRLLGYPYFHTRYKLVIQGQEHIPPQCPAILLAKHQSWTDIPILTLAIKHHIHYVAKKELFEKPLIKNFFYLMGGIPIDRKNPLNSLDSFKYIHYILSRRQYLVIFPEGTYFPNRMGPGKYRLIQLILKYQEENRGQLPFVPIGIKYEERNWRQKVNITIGLPLYAKAEQGAEEFTRLIMTEIAHCCAFS